ncbi:MAG: inorganic phosphate transporter [Cyclobacteriaceae bacterium]|jgi:PiT family inorganic phosphate transporter|nr:anion permease [Cytophagales bacterium]HNP76770.1 inorganic phosphate transporter [Cyclobacteriaceae bacterium]
MFELDFAYSALLIICLLAACSFEFVNGFHDTANAVATVIYTNSLKPWVAVIWSGFMNSMGVLYGGIAVAMGIVNLLPVESLVDQNITHSICMVAALLLSAIFWNLLTWYLGIPCSSSHTLIGSILGVGIAYSFLPDAASTAVNWTKAEEIGISLLISPMVGFTLTIILMYLIRVTTKGKPYGEDLFKEPKKNTPPPPWIRGTLLLTCTSVSFFHGQNDGQKGVGLIMLILIGIVPGFFALNANFDTTKLREPISRIESVISTIDATPLSAPDREKLAAAKEMNADLHVTLDSIGSVNALPREARFKVRKDILVMDRNLSELMKKEEARVSESDKKILKENLKSVRKLTDYSPGWVIILISVSLGLGTMIGWKRIVKTIGEKIGKEHLSYAQGASAELVAASTIGMSSYLGLPVSTTHVLSSGIAGSMVANKGVKNLQPDTVRNILIAWFLTLPVVILMSGSLFLLFRAIF